MLPDRVSNPGPLTYESGALPIALRGPACSLSTAVIDGLVVRQQSHRLCSSSTAVIDGLVVCQQKSPTGL